VGDGLMREKPAGYGMKGGEPRLIAAIDWKLAKR
jgi:hypothetical protein